VAVGVVAGLVLAAICGAELVAGVMAVTLSSGRVLLGLGIALDACARALGALDAGRAGKAGWAWSCAIIGSPAVVAAALSWRRGEIRIEAAPLAGLIAGLAIVFVVVGLVA
jgi:ferric-dicitrate binding protein FerR (iron transport regulator)